MVPDWDDVWDATTPQSRHARYFRSNCSRLVSLEFCGFDEERDEDDGNRDDPNGEEKCGDFSPRDHLRVTERTHDCCTSVGTEIGNLTLISFYAKVAVKMLIKNNLQQSIARNCFFARIISPTSARNARNKRHI